MHVILTHEYITVKKGLCNGADIDYNKYYEIIYCVNFDHRGAQQNFVAGELPECAECLRRAAEELVRCRPVIGEQLSVDNRHKALT